MLNTTRSGTSIGYEAIPNQRNLRSRYQQLHRKENLRLGSYECAWLCKHVTKMCLVGVYCMQSLDNLTTYTLVSMHWKPEKHFFAIEFVSMLTHAKGMRS